MLLLLLTTDRHIFRDYTATRHILKIAIIIIIMLAVRRIADIHYVQKLITE